jgi:ubiquinone/menaquinone biosynthesis C-methylase UbiE
MLVRDWERTYREKGQIYFRILPKIRSASLLFKARGYKRILDLGCGTGRHSIYLAKKGFDVYATDISPTGIEITREKAESLGLQNMHFQQLDMISIPFADNFFDAVVCTRTLHHGTLAQIQKTINEIYRVLRPGGTLVTDLLSVRPGSYGMGREIEKNTFIGDKIMEEDVLHHYTTKEEILRLFSQFQQLRVRLRTVYYKDRDKKTGKRYYSKRFHVQAVK